MEKGPGIRGKQCIIDGDLVHLGPGEVWVRRADNIDPREVPHFPQPGDPESDARAKEIGEALAAGIRGLRETLYRES